MLKRLAVVVAALISAVASAFALPITLRVDATDAPRKIYHAELNIPAAPGPLTLFYPKWIPGDHAPTGPINDLAGLRISAGGEPVGWGGGSGGIVAVPLHLPLGRASVCVEVRFLSPPPEAGQFPGPATT